MAEEAFEIPVQLSIGDLRKQLKQIKSELANATNPEDMARLSEKAGELQDNLMRVNEQAAIFSSGSKFEQSANALGLMNSQLASMDFEGAAESALLLQDRINSITPQEITKQMNGLTSMFGTLGKISGQAIIGMIKNIGAMARAFMAFGAQLLMNPIFIFAIVIAAIVGAIALLLSKLGLLKPILDAIGAVFGWIGDAIDAVVQAIKDFLDWLGLTDYAAEDSARRHTKAMEDKADAYEKSGAKIVKTIEETIKLAQVDGKRTVELEIGKQRIIKKTAEVRLEALKAKYDENKLTEEMDEEEIKALHEKIAAQKELIRNSSFEVKLIRAKDAQDQKEEAEQAKKDGIAAAKDNAAKAKQYRADRLAAERLFRDQEIALMEVGVEKEIAMNAEKYKRLIEDTKSNEKLIGEEKRKIIETYQKQQVKADQEIRDAAAKKRKDEIAEEVAEFAGTTEMLKEGFRKRKEAELREELEKTEKLAELAVMKNENDLKAQQDLLDAKRELELNDKDITEEDKALIEERYRQEREKLEKESADRRKQIEQQVANATGMALEGIASLNDLVLHQRTKGLEKGSEAEEKAAKRNFEINKKVQIAQAGMQGIQAALAAYSSGAAIPVVGMVTGPLFAALAGAAALNNINQIKSKTFSGGGGSGGGSAAGGGSPSVSAAATSAPSFNMFGKPNEGNNLSEKKEKDQVINLTVDANISESQVTEVQKKVIKYENGATLTNNG